MLRRTLPLLWFSLAFLAGILLGSACSWAWIDWLALGVFPPLLAFVLSSFPLPDRLRSLAQPFLRSVSLLGIAPGLLWLALFGGAARYQLAQPTITATDLAWYNDQGLAEIEGVVAAIPDRRDDAVLLRVRAGQITPLEGEQAGATIPVHGTLLVRLPVDADWTYGDRVLLTGSPETPPELDDFSYRDYLARQGIYTYLSYARADWLDSGQGNPVLAAIYSLRERLLSIVEQIFPPDEAALLSGILLGEEGRIPDELDQAFTDTGTAHIIAISGFNITILAGLFSAIFCKLLGRRRGFSAAILGIGFYAILVGAGASVVRAAIMGGLALFARQIGRRQVGLNTLAFTAFVMTLVQPQALWEASFQLSFFATLGLVLYAAPLQEWFVRVSGCWLPGEVAKRLAQPVGEYLLFTLAAQVTTLPVILVQFQRLSWVSLLANPLVLPPQPLVMVLGGLAALLGLIALPLGQIAAYAAWPFVAYTIRMVELLDRIPHAAVDTGAISAWWAAAFYVVLLGGTFAWPYREKLRPYFRPAVALAGAAVLACLVWEAALARPDGRLRLTVFPSEKGQATLIQTAQGRTLLVGGEPSASHLLSQVSRRLSLFTPEIDALLVTGERAADVAGLSRLVERYAPPLVIWNGSFEGSSAAETFAISLADQEIKPLIAQAGQRLDLGDGGILEIISASETGVCLLLDWGNFRAVWLTEEAVLPADLTQITVLIVSNVPFETMDRIGDNPPQLLLGSGSKATVANHFDPAQNGWIQVTTDGEQMWVEVEGK